MERDPLTEQIIGCAIEVHRALGPGLLESAYQQCLAHEFQLQGVSFVMEEPVSVTYKEVTLDCGYRLDFLVDGKVIIELKSVEKIMGIHQAQLLTYMKLAKVARGLLVNFNTPRLVDGIKRFRL